jgi:vacuolar iron transporter family protein
MPLTTTVPRPHHHHGHPHTEHHFGSGEVVRDIVIGMSDGLTVPFALAAGIAGAHASSRLVVVAGLAEIAAGSIAMGLGGFLAARTDAEHYHNELAREQREVVEMPGAERAEIYDIMEPYGLEHHEIKPIVDALERDPKQWVDFMMKYELGLEEPDPKRAYSSAGTIAASYIAGGFVPLLPYILVREAKGALLWSVAMTAIALAVFGYFKGYFTGSRPVRSAAQTLMIGAIAAACAYGLASLFS